MDRTIGNAIDSDIAIPTVVFVRMLTCNGPSYLVACTWIYQGGSQRAKISCSYLPMEHGGT